MHAVVPLLTPAFLIRRFWTCILFLISLPALAQKVDRGLAALPDAPGFSTPTPPPASNSTPASLSGTVLDINGGMVPGARLTLDNAADGFTRVVIADSEGRFVFDGIPPGTYTLSIAAKDLQTYTLSAFALHSGEHREIPRVALPIARTSADVQVTVTQVELATEQVHSEEQQRVFGVFPNFYSSYIWDAAPLNPRQKFSLALRAAVDPVAFLGAGFAAGVQQASDAYKGYGQGAAGYGKRYGANYADGAIGLMLSDALLPSVLHQDPRYFYKGSGTTRSRVLYAMSTAFICKGDNGRWQPNYSHILGGLATGAISNAYYPSSDRGVSLTIDNWLIGTGGDMVGGLIREFALRRLTHKVPAYEQGKDPGKP